MFAIPSVSCCPCVCSCQGNVTVNIGGSGGGSLPPGTTEPEGALVGSVGDWYHRVITDLVDEFWYKATGDLTPYGWQLVIKLA